MLEKIKDLIFGLNDFEKTKIELRFKEVLKEIEKVSISKLDDFEILEKIIYKIKEELRVKSSNLNKVISNQERDLTKGDVKHVIGVLERKKFDFLEHAFNVINNEKEIQNEIEEPNLELEEEPQDVVEETPAVDTHVEKAIKEVEEDKEINLDILKNDDYEIRIENGKVPYIVVDFFKKVDYVLLKNISALFFEIYSMEGSNIIVESNKALIVPRKMSDNLIELPKVESNLEDVYSKLKENLEEKENPQDNNKEEKDVEPVTDEEYNEIVHEVKSKETTTTKEQDNSLDSLIEGFENKKDEKESFVKKDLKKEDNNQKVEFIPDDSKVEIEKVDDEIEIGGEEIPIEKKEEIKEVSEKTKEIQKDHDFEIYRDDKIVAYFDENSKVLGELVVESLNHENIGKLDQNTLTYMSIFSKVFASILFETLEAHGTNIIWNFENTRLRIVPRYQGDEIKNLDWEKKENTQDFLEQVKNKLHLEMSKELESEEKGEGKVKEVKQDKSPVRKDGSIKEKGQYVLKELRRLP